MCWWEGSTPLLIWIGSLGERRELSCRGLALSHSGNLIIAHFKPQNMAADESYTLCIESCTTIPTWKSGNVLAVSARCDSLVWTVYPVHKLTAAKQRSCWSTGTAIKRSRFRFSPIALPRGGWQRGSVVRTSVFGWRTFPDLRLIYRWHVTTLSGKCPLWVNQPGQISLPSFQGQ